MKLLNVILLLIIIGLTIGLIRERARYDDLLTTSQQAEVQALSECRESVAELRFQCQANETGFEESDPVQKITDLQAMLQNRRLQARENTVDELTEALKSDNNIKPEILSALKAFDERRRALIGRSRERGTYLTPDFHRALNELRQDTGRKLEQQLNDEQWRRLVADGYLQRLGLTPVELTDRGELPAR